MSPATGDSWAARRVAVVGAGVSGLGAARALAARGAAVVLLDGADGDRQRAAAAEVVGLGGTARLGGLPAAPGPDVDLVVTSPGLRPDTPYLVAAGAAGVPVLGEVELAWQWTGATRWLCVTGTNGKTTTTEMLGAILAAAGRSATTAGNIGTPIVEAVGARPPYEVLAVELSSFQLHWSASVAPVAAAILNIADDHLDWHGGPAAYADAKARLWAHPETIAIGNADDPVVAERLAAAAGRQVTFGLRSGASGGPGGPGLTVEDGVLVDRAFGGGRLLPVAELGATGPHNVANALAAAALARAYGIGVGPIGAALAAFRPGAHRNQVVARVDGVDFVDDSKATNPHAAAASLAAYRSVVWIAGGLNKGLSFDDLIVAVRDHVRAAVLIGRCAPEVAAAMARHAPDVPVEAASSMDDAVEAAAKLARPGDTGLLPPAAASMDMFRDYPERADRFPLAARARGGSGDGARPGNLPP